MNAAIVDEETMSLSKTLTFVAVENNAESLAQIKEIVDKEEVAIVWDENENIVLGGYEMYQYIGVNPEIQMYDWLADSTTTLHVVNNHEAFTQYEETLNTSVTGVGRIHTEI